jgi:hypothetical protein
MISMDALGALLGLIVSVVGSDGKMVAKLDGIALLQAPG